MEKDVILIGDGDQGFDGVGRGGECYTNNTAMIILINLFHRECNTTWCCVSTRFHCQILCMKQG